MKLTTAALPVLAGRPGLAQGSYGDAGNLELVAPAADGGFWVFWFNADPVDHRSGAARGCWSGGLHVFGARPVEAVRITQVQAGPRFLEAVALSDGALHRLHWSPDAGFVTDGVIATGIVAISATVEVGAQLHVLAVASSGSLLHLLGDASSYPAVTWSTRPVSLDGCAAVALTSTCGAVVRPDGIDVLQFGSWSVERTVAGSFHDVALADGVVIGLGRDGVAGVRADAVAAAATSLDGGRIDVVLAAGNGLVHLHGDGTTWSTPAPVVSTVWLAEGAPIHRRDVTA